MGKSKGEVSHLDLNVRSFDHNFSGPIDHIDCK